MSFVYPGFLFALAVLAIPVIIHLFSFRRFKTIYFSNVRFLREVKDESAARERLRHLLVLISRLLALAFLVFAFAQPFIPAKDAEVQRGQRAVGIYIDNSFSMDAIGDEVPLVQIAREKALEIANGYEAGDRFQLLTNDFEGRHQRLLDRDQFIAYVREVQVGPSVRTLEQVQTRMLQATQGFDRPDLFFISDFQENMVDLVPDTNANLYMVPLRSPRQVNVSVDSVWMDAPVQLLDQTARVFVKLTNHGSQPVEESDLALWLNNDRKALGEFTIEVGQSIIDTLNFTVTQAGWNGGYVEITDYPITFDDRFFFSFYTPENIEVLVINRQLPNPWLAGLSGQNFLKVQQIGINQVNYGTLSNYRMVVLDQLDAVPSGLADALRLFVEEGGNVLVFPERNADLNSYNTFLRMVGADALGAPVEKTQTFANINISSGIFADVFDKLPENILLPTVYRYFTIERAVRSTGEVLISLRDGAPLLVHYRFARGSAYISAVPLDAASTDFPRHSLFVISVVQIAISGSSQFPLAYTLGADQSISLPATGSDLTYRIRSTTEGAEMDVIPPQQPLGSNLIVSLTAQGGSYDFLRDAGLYELYLPGNDVIERLLAFNFDRRESDIRMMDSDALAEALAGSNVQVLEKVETNLASIVGKLSRGTALWKLCLILALVFLGAEVLLLRFWPRG